MYISAPGNGKEVVGYKMTYIQNGRSRQRVFATERRASRFRRSLPFGANSQLVPVVRSGKK